MLLMKVCLILNAALLCVVPAQAVPLKSKTPDLANVPYREWPPSQIDSSDRKGEEEFVSAESNEGFFHGLQRKLADIDNNPEDPAPPGSELSKQALDAKGANHELTRLQQRNLGSNPALILINQANSLSNSTGKLKTKIDHEVECFPVGSHLTNAVADDCRFIINHIILGMDNPFQVQTWGFRNGLDINLSLDEYEWIHQDCYMRVQNDDETQVDRFRPVDVAEQALRIVETCVVDVKQPLGGFADVGNLGFEKSFYIVASGTEFKPGLQRIGSSNVPSLPSDIPRTLESRADPESLQESAISNTSTGRLGRYEAHPVRCFDPSFARRLQPAVVSDCNVVIDEIILRLPNVMREQSFGYTSDEDVDLTIKENGQWIWDQCVIFVRELDRQGSDIFSYADVVIAAKRVIEQCVEGSKYALGGTSGVGRKEESFYVTVGGLTPTRGNDTFLVLPSDAPVSSSLGRLSVPASLHI